MKKIFLAVGVLLLGNLCAFAQQGGISIGARGGLSIPKIRALGDNPMSQNYGSRLTGGGGVYAEFHFSNLFSLRPGVEYMVEGGERDGMQAIPARMLPAMPPPIQSQMPPYLYANFNSKTSFDYLMVPVLAQFGWNVCKSAPLRIYVNGGPFVSFLLSANQTTSGSSQIYMNREGTATLDQALAPYHIPPIGAKSFNTDSSIKSQTNSVNWGITGNVGLSYQINKHSIFIEAGGNYGFRTMQKDVANGENRIGAGTVMLGYAYHL